MDKQKANEDISESDTEHLDESLIYSVNENPPWPMTILLGMQHFFTMSGGVISTPIILAPFLCITGNFVAINQLLNTGLFISGIATLCQSTFGVRLPIIQGPSASFIVPAISILSLEKFQCSNPDASNDWELRIREIQGATMIASCLQIFLGITGLAGLLARFVTPLVIASTISAVGLSLATVAVDLSSVHWGLSSLTAVLMLIFSQYLGGVNVPIVGYSRSDGFHVIRTKLFALLPVLISIIIAWFVAGICTSYNVIDGDARTDAKLSVLQDADWLYTPYPGQFGTPTVSVSSVLGITTGVIAGIAESMGDYYAAAKLSGAPPLPKYAINRGVFIEGAMCFMSGAFGTSVGVTSYSQNIGTLGITKVGSRICVQIAGVIMVVLGLFGKLGALFVMIPTPIIGGLFLVTFAMVAGSGVSNLADVDLKSSRNLIIYGFSIVVGLGLPYWARNPENRVDTSIVELDNLINVILNNGMFLAGLVSLVLESTIPRHGVTFKRGIRETNADECLMVSSTYNIPFPKRVSSKLECLSFLPFSSKKDSISDNGVDMTQLEDSNSSKVTNLEDVQV